MNHHERVGHGGVFVEKSKTFRIHYHCVYASRYHGVY